MEMNTGSKNANCRFHDEATKMMLVVETWHHGSGTGSLTIQLWDIRAEDTYWKGSLQELADIIEEHLERDRIPEPVTMATVGPLRDNGNPFETGVPY
jgi:hypothetical protein